MASVEFDPRKDVVNRLKHGVSLVLALEFAWSSAKVEPDERRAYGEERFRAIGFIGGRLYVVVFTRRGEALRIIGLRKANRRERRRYGQAHEAPAH